MIALTYQMKNVQKDFIQGWKKIGKPDISLLFNRTHKVLDNTRRLEKEIKGIKNFWEEVKLITCS